jgi:hypothetical protein
MALTTLKVDKDPPGIRVLLLRSGKVMSVRKGAKGGGNRLQKSRKEMLTCCRLYSSRFLLRIFLSMDNGLGSRSNDESELELEMAAAAL